ncbi:MAG: WecB/TagA/CpsF family glycosyltransferase [Bacteroidales bacterium]|nr:WecB/TagA/CpsF family glycosyltransferase [Bacteroidales bacterium]
MQAYPLINCPCYNATSEKDVEKFLQECIEENRGGYTVAINALKIVKYNNDEETKSVIDRALLQAPDGFGAVYAFKILHNIKVVRIDLPGIALNVANKMHLKLIVVGASEENNSLAVQNINRLYPGINVVNHINGFFKSIDVLDDLISNHTPDMVLIGMGSPKQEKISAQLFKKYPNVLYIGCGGRIDVLSGNVKRAPAWIQKYKLEGAYRVMAQPRRIPDLLKVLEYFKLLWKYKNKR